MLAVLLHRPLPIDFPKDDYLVSPIIRAEDVVAHMRIHIDMGRLLERYWFEVFSRLDPEPRAIVLSGPRAVIVYRSK